MYIEPENTVENEGYILACHYFHKVFPDGTNAISNDGIESIDGKEWEMFAVRSESKDAYYGMPLEGLGLIDCMLLKSDTRKFTDAELKKWSKRLMRMEGANTGKLSYHFEVNVTQCEPKL